MIPSFYQKVMVKNIFLIPATKKITKLKDNSYSMLICFFQAKKQMVGRMLIHYLTLI